jgi:predicted short-subunit dehydrogenase-like oxidoreductase (DUF2520 family)
LARVVQAVLEVAELVGLRPAQFCKQAELQLLVVVQAELLGLVVGMAVLAAT